MVDNFTVGKLGCLTDSHSLMIEGECRNRDHKEGAPKLILIPYSLLGACTGNPDGNDMSVAGNISGKRDRYGYRSEYAPFEILIMCNAYTDRLPYRDTCC